jgi:hypothetical protein
MSDGIRTRVLILAGLAGLGVALAGVGATVGTTPFSTAADSAPHFVVSDQNVSVSTGERTETLVENMSGVQAVTINETATGHFTVDTGTEGPLTETERQRAKEIALDNRTVRQELGTVDGYEFVVEPIRKIESSEMSQQRYNTTFAIEPEGEGNVTITAWNTTTETENESVRLVRDPSYVEEQVSVRVHRPSDPGRRSLKHTMTVDLANKTVTDITDWVEIRQNSPSVNVTERLNESTVRTG